MEREWQTKGKAVEYNLPGLKLTKNRIRRDTGALHDAGSAGTKGSHRPRTWDDSERLFEGREVGK
jgi:hypothetical protein